MEQKYNMKSPAVKRLMREAIELCDPTEDYYAQPVEDNLFEWHFTVRGPTDSDFSGGIYHGRIILPPEYPMKPPSIILLTPNGRFEVNVRICLSISGYHPESWQPSWSIRTALLAIIGFMPSQGMGAIGSLDYKPDERAALAKKSHDWKCSVCGSIKNILVTNANVPRKVNQEAKDLATQISFKSEVERKSESFTTETQRSADSDEIIGQSSRSDSVTSEGNVVARDDAAHGNTEANHTALRHRTRDGSSGRAAASAAVEIASQDRRCSSNLLTAIAVLLFVAIVALVLRRLLLL